MKFVILLLCLISLNLAIKVQKPVLPWSAKTSTETKGWALEQTTAARKLFYSPSTNFSLELSKVAANLAELTATYLPLFDDKEWKEYRIIGPGSMAGKTKAELVAAIKRVADNKAATANDRSSVISFLGDIGTIIADGHGKDKLNDKYRYVNGNITRFLVAKKLRGMADTEIAQFSELRAGTYFAPAKRAERNNSLLANGKPELKSRKGIFETGLKADSNLGIAPANQIVNVTWPVQLIEEKRINDPAVTEPWAGHMSGSLPEVLLCWDILTGVDPTISIDPTKIKANKLLDAEPRRIRAIAASANLIGLGFHSAMECREPADAYRGIYYRDEILKKAGPSGNQDMATIHGKGPDSTKYMVDLIKQFTLGGKRRMKKMY
jgi:hypothetical protein